MVTVLVLVMLSCAAGETNTVSVAVLLPVREAPSQAHATVAELVNVPDALTETDSVMGG